VEKHMGVKSVCEAAAIKAARSGQILVPKQKTKNATVAVAALDFL
jgi:cobalt-precorrin 5A hydrolase